MGQSSNFYYIASVHTGGRPPFYVPLSGVHFGSRPTGSWFSAEAKSFPDLKNLFERIDPTVPVFLSMPKIYSGVFFKSASFPKVAVLAYPPPKARNSLGGDSYMRGGCHVLHFPDLTVGDSVPVHGTTVPLYPPTLKRELEKNLGMGAYHFIRVSARVGDSVSVEEGHF